MAGAAQRTLSAAEVAGPPQKRAQSALELAVGHGDSLTETGPGNNTCSCLVVAYEL